MATEVAPALARLQDDIVGCVRCPRLVAHQRRVADEKVRRFRDETYWGRPVPSFGDPRARLLVIGLAPAAHGANRTGRAFTGDRSGEWLYEALHRYRFASLPRSRHRRDGLTLHDCYITQVIHCAPPGNRPERHEIANCQPFFLQELQLLRQVEVVLPLGTARLRRLPARLPATGSSVAKAAAALRARNVHAPVDGPRPAALLPPEPAEHPDGTTDARHVPSRVRRRARHARRAGTPSLTLSWQSKKGLPGPFPYENPGKSRQNRTDTVQKPYTSVQFPYTPTPKNSSICGQKSTESRPNVVKNPANAAKKRP